MNEFFELDEHQKKSLEKKLRKYPYIDRLIAIRETELDKREEADENIGGSRSGFVGRPTEAIALKRQSDPYIVQHQKLKSDIAAIIRDMDDRTREIVHKRYWDTTNYYTWEDLAKEYRYSVSTIYRKRDKLLNDLARREGLI